MDVYNIYAFFWIKFGGVQIKYVQVKYHWNYGDLIPIRIHRKLDIKFSGSV